MQLRMLWVHVHLLQVVKTRMSRILCSSGALLIARNKMATGAHIPLEKKERETQLKARG